MFVFLLIVTICSINSIRPQYLLFTRPPGLHWSQDNPESITGSFLREVPNVLGYSSDDGSLFIGNEMIFSLFQTPIATLVKSIQATLTAAEESNIPVSLVLDGQNWWQNSGLWNWWNASMPGYNASNIKNVEWTRPNDPTSAVKIGWRNWGSQIRVIPEQNILSSIVQDTLDIKIRAVTAVIAKWWNMLPDGSKYLLATVKVGWEAGLQYNAFYYENGNTLVNTNPKDDPTTGLNFSLGIGAGQPILGYAAAKSAGIKIEPGHKLTGQQAAILTQIYVSKLSSVVVSAGIPTEYISNHVGGQVPPYKAVPFSAAFVNSSLGTPGWSFYWTIPQKTPLLHEMNKYNRKKWAAAEWYLRASDKQGWLSNFNNTLTFLNCEHIAVYNWDDMFEKDIHGCAAVQELLKLRTKMN